MVAAIFEAKMSREQAGQLAELMQEHRPTRSEGVFTAMLLVDGDDVTLVAVWRDRETLDAYLAIGAVPRGTELMRKVGVEPNIGSSTCSTSASPGGFADEPNDDARPAPSC